MITEALQNAASSAGFSWNISANGVMISLTIIGMGVKAIHKFSQNWDAFQDTVEQSKLNQKLLEQHEKILEEVRNLAISSDARLRTLEDIFRSNLGKRVGARGTD